MKEEFRYGEKVKARDRDDEPWQSCYYIAKAERDGTSFYITVLEEENVKLPNFDEFLTCCWYQIRKVQPEETTNEKEILEQRLDNFEAILNGSITNTNGRLENLEREIYKLKNPLKFE